MKPVAHALGAWLLGALALAASAPARALDSQDCRPKDLADDARAASTAMAATVARALDARGARLAVLARVGRNMQNYGLRYSHVGLVTRAAPGGAWKVVHLLNTCGTDRSALHEQTLAEFFQDNPFNYESLVALPPPAWQTYLSARLDDTAGRQAVFRDHYSAIAYPFNRAFQNSNGWVLDWLAAAETRAADPSAPPPSRTATIAALQDHGYAPGHISVRYGDRLGAIFTAANVSFVDHPLAERLSGSYSVVTVESLLAYGCRRGWLERLVSLPTKGEPAEATCATFDFPPATGSGAAPDARPAVLSPAATEPAR